VASEVVTENVEHHAGRLIASICKIAAEGEADIPFNCRRSMGQASLSKQPRRSVFAWSVILVTDKASSAEPARADFRSKFAKHLCTFEI
jgi:hypothetical protein